MNTLLDRNKSLSHFAGKWLVAFFITMVVLTIISNVSSSLTVAKVKISKASKGLLTFTAEGTGEFSPHTEAYVKIKENLRINQIHIQSGQTVKVGDPLFTYNLEELQTLYNDKQKEVTKAQLQLDKLQLSYHKQLLASSLDNVKNGNLRAKLDLKTAELTLEKAMKDYDKALEDTITSDIRTKQTAYDEALKNQTATERSNKEALLTIERAIIDAKEEFKLAEDTETKLKKQYQTELTSAEDTVYNATSALNDTIARWDRLLEVERHKLNAIDPSDPSYPLVLSNYETLYASKQSETIAAQRVLSNTQNALELLKEKKVVDTAKATAQKKLTRLEEDFLLIQEKCEALKSDATIKLQKATEELQKAGADTSTYKKELSSSLEAIDSAHKGIETAKRNLEDTTTDLTTAQKNQSIANNNMKVDSQMGQIDLKGYQLERNVLQKELAQLNELLLNKGTVIAPTEGVIVQCQLQKGQFTSGLECVSITANTWSFKGILSKEDAKHVSIGDPVYIKLPTNQKTIETTIESITQANSDETIQITTLLPQGDYTLGATLSFETKKNSKPYDLCVPIQAIRIDTKGSYILVINEKNTTLGNEQIASRVTVKLLNNDHLTAAISGILTLNEQIIIGSNKPIEIGDRVRIESHE